MAWVAPILVSVSRETIAGFAARAGDKVMADHVAKGQVPIAAMARLQVAGRGAG